MIQLPHNCRCSEPKIYAPSKKDWHIQYRFYDDNYKDKYPKGKLVIVKGMNGFKDLDKRRKLADTLKDDILKALRTGYSPIMKGFPYAPADTKINSKMPFLSALRFADSKITVSKQTREKETTYLLNQIEIAAKNQGIANYPVQDIGRRHLLEICEAVSLKSDKTKSPDKFNRCRKVLKYYYKQLVNYEIAPADPITFDKQKGGIKKVKNILTAEQQKKISDHLKTNYYNFWLYTQIFHNIAPRSSELLRVKVADVDLINQRVKFLIKKGKQYAEKYRIIPTIIVPLMRQVIGNAPSHYFVFGADLQPSETAISPTQINRRWKRLVMDKLKGVNITFYQLKHQRLTELTNEYGNNIAAGQAAENKETVSKFYDLNKSRHDEILKGSGKLF